MAWQGGQVQLEQFHMLLALNMAEWPQKGFWLATIEEMQYLIKNPSANVQYEKRDNVVFPRYKIVKAATQRHPALDHDNLMNGCLCCKNRTANISKMYFCHWNTPGVV
jgi:hypothetical protein